MDKKTVELGTFSESESRKIGKYWSALHVRVELEISDADGGPRLSICGETYRPGARDVESAGQIQDDVRRLLADPGAKLAKPRTQIERLLAVWDRWHLNDMRPGCEHQRDWDTSAPVEMVTYKLKSDVLKRQYQLGHAAQKRLEAGETVTYTAAERALAALPSEVKRGLPLLPVQNLDFYEVSGREVKTVGWLRPSEHPAGILNKPCPRCGYEYGTAWLYEPLPADVVKFVEDF